MFNSESLKYDEMASIESIRDFMPVALIDSIWWILQQVKLRIVSLRRNPTYIIIGITQCQALRDRLTPEWPLKDKMNKIITVWHTLLLYYYIMLCYVKDFTQDMINWQNRLVKILTLR
jgi:hypothetical protein